MDLSQMRAPEIAYAGLGPLILLVVGALLVLLLDAFTRGSRPILGGMTAAVLAAAGGWTVMLLGTEVAAPFPGMYAADDFAHVFDLVFYVSALATVVLSLRWHPAVDRGEYYALILFATAGMVVLAHATHFVTIFIGLELLSIVLYALTGFLRDRAQSAEAALKYFFLGAFASAFLLYGSALVYGMTASLDLEGIGARVSELAASPSGPPLLLVVGACLALSGFLFKISSVPFHMWTPDVYDGAPTPIAGFMSVATKAAAFAALMRVLTTGFGALTSAWQMPVATVAVATMLVGNLIALRQLNLKRMLAFSSVAHAGYGLIGLVTWGDGGREALAFYLIAYAAMNLGAFGVIAALERRGEGLFVRDLAGLSQRRPLAAAAMALFLLSLAGVPPTAGFAGKFSLFMSAVEGGWIVLAVLGVLYSAIAAYYYLRVIVYMYMRPTPDGLEELAPMAPGAALVLAAAASAVVFLGLAPSGLWDLLETAVAGL